MWAKEKLLDKSNFFFFHYVVKGCLLLMRQNEYLWSEGLKLLSLLSLVYHYNDNVNDDDDDDDDDDD